MGFCQFRLRAFLCIALIPAASAQVAPPTPSPVRPDPSSEATPVDEPTLRNQIRVAADRVCTLEVQGPRPTVLIRQASAFLIAPDRAVTSARALAGGFGVLVRIGQSTTGAKLIGLDLLHDVAILKLHSSFDVGQGLKLHGTELLGNEQVAIMGTTTTMEQVAGLGTLFEATQPAPLSTFGLAKNLSQSGLEGAPILNVQGHVVGMITSYLHKESETRFVVSSAAILTVPSMNPVDLAPGLIPGNAGGQTPEQAKEWQATEQGIQLLLSGQRDQAVDILEGNSTQAGIYWHALALIASDRNVEAREAMDAHLKKHPSDATGFLLRGQAHQQLMENKEAMSDFRMARGFSKDGIFATMALARAYMQADRGQESLKLLKNLLIKTPGYVPAILQRGKIFADRLRLSEARICYENILAIDPDHPGAWAGLGQVHLIKKSSRRALMCFDRALHKDAGSLVSKIGRAEVFIQKREWDQALECLLPLLEENPTHANIIMLTAHAYGRSQEREKARDLYEQATFLYPDNEDAFLGLGTTYKAMAEYERAIAAFDNVLRIAPKHAGAIFSAGFCHLLLGDRGKARARYKTLRFIDPASADQLFKMIYNK